MPILALNPAHHRFSTEWSLELCSSGGAKTVALGGWPIPSRTWWRFR